MAVTVEAAARRARALGWVEAHPVLAIVLLAVAVRAILVAAVQVHSSGALFLDDVTYSRMAADAATGGDNQWSDYTHGLYQRTAVLLVPITHLYEAFGIHDVLGQAWAAILGVAAAGLTTRLALEVLAVRWAMVAGAIVALLPSQVLWSSIVMKDSGVWAILAAIALMVALANRSTGWRLAAYGAGAAAGVLLLGYLRLHTLEVAAVAVMLASFFGIREWRIPRVAGAVAILLFVPMWFDLGPAGATFVKDTGSLEETRTNNAKLAKSAVVETAPDVQLTDNQSPLQANLSYLPEGAAVMVLRPFPWEGENQSNGVKLARVESVFWYVIVAFALVGLFTVRRRLDAWTFPLLAGGATLVMYALTEGNLGTAYRHRGEFVWVTAMLAAAGCAALARRYAARRARPA